MTPTPTSIADIGQRKSKKKRAASPVASASSGEEYDPSRGDTAAAMSVAATKPRQPRPKARKSNNNNSRTKGLFTKLILHVVFFMFNVIDGNLFLLLHLVWRQRIF